MPKLPDLSKYSLDDLKKLEKELAKAIKSFEARKRKEVLAEVSALAKKSGFDLADLISAPTKKGKRSSAVPKYAHPENPTTTWTGRGRRPAWVIEYVDAGKPLDDLLIK